MSSSPKKCKKPSQWKPSNYLQYNLHRKCPIDPEDTKTIKAFRLNKIYASYKSKNNYLVICNHKKCAQKAIHRLPFYSFINNHHNEKHEGKSIDCSIVSHLTYKRHQLNGSKNKGVEYLHEYKLRDFQTLEWINPNNIGSETDDNETDDDDDLVITPKLDRNIRKNVATKSRKKRKHKAIETKNKMETKPKGHCAASPPRKKLKNYIDLAPDSPFLCAQNDENHNNHKHKNIKHQQHKPNPDEFESKAVLLADDKSTGYESGRDSLSDTEPVNDAVLKPVVTLADLPDMTFDLDENSDVVPLVNLSQSQIICLIKDQHETIKNLKHIVSDCRHIQHHQKQQILALTASKKTSPKTKITDFFQRSNPTSNTSKTNEIKPTQIAKFNIFSHSIKHFVLSEGKNIFALTKIENNCYLFHCKLCRFHYHKKDSFKDDRTLYIEGIKLSEQAVSDRTILKHYKQGIQKHLQSQLHLNTYSMQKHTKITEIGPILIKIELVYNALLRGNDSIKYFEENIYFLHRLHSRFMNNVHPKHHYIFDVGSKCHGIAEYKKIEGVIFEVINKRLFRVISVPLHHQKPLAVVFYSLSIDGWSRWNFSTEVLVIKFHQNWTTKVMPLDLFHFNYTTEATKKDSAFTAKAIGDTLKKWKIAPVCYDDDDFAMDLDDDDTEFLYCCRGITSDGPYLHAKAENGGTKIEQCLSTQIALGPLFNGWHYDDMHEIEVVRKRVNKTNKNYAFFFGALSEGLEMINTPKWVQIMKSVQDEFGVKGRGFKKMCFHRFWRHSLAAMIRIESNAQYAFYILDIMESDKNYVKKTQKFRENWSSLQFMLMLLLAIDCSGSFNHLSITLQRTNNILPFERVHNIRKGQNRLIMELRALHHVKKVFEAHHENQFMEDYSIRHEIDGDEIVKDVLPRFYEKLDDLLNFTYFGRSLSARNIFYSYYTNHYDESRDPAQELTENEFLEIFGESEYEDDDADDSDYDYRADLDQIINVDEIDKARETRRRSERLKMRPDFNPDSGSKLDEECDEKCDKSDTYWFRCHGCSGYICDIHLIEKYKIDVSEYPEDVVLCIMDDYLCKDCCDLFVDVIQTIIKYNESFKVEYFDEGGVKSEAVMNGYDDIHWEGLNVFGILFRCYSLGFDKKKIRKEFLNDTFLGYKIDELWKLYNIYKAKTNGSVYNRCFQALKHVFFRSVVDFKRYIIEYILNNIDLWNEKEGGINLMDLKHEMYQRLNYAINKYDEFEPLRILWNLSVSDIHTEAIVESVCSAIKRIYNCEKTQIHESRVRNLLLSKLCLTNNEKQRNYIVDQVTKQYIKQYGSSHHINNVRLRQRMKVDGNTNGSVLNKMYNEKPNLFTLQFK